MAGSIKAELQLDISLGGIMDLVVAWEEVNGVEYHPEAKHFRKVQQDLQLGPRARSAQGDPTWKEMQACVEELKTEIRCTKGAQRSKSQHRVSWAIDR